MGGKHQQGWGGPLQLEPPQDAQSSAELLGCSLPATLPPFPLRSGALSYKQTPLDNLGKCDDGTSLRLGPGGSCTSVAPWRMLAQAWMLLRC